MSTSTIESRIPSLEEPAPLELGLPQTEKAWFHAFAHKAVDAWVALTGGGSDPINHKYVAPGDSGEELSMEHLLETRTQRVA